jgi:hypothetical protein
MCIRCYAGTSAWTSTSSCTAPPIWTVGALTVGLAFGVVSDLDLPGWTINLSERSPGVWRLEARDETGRSVETVVHDVDRAFQRLKDYDIGAGSASPDATDP